MAKFTVNGNAQNISTFDGSSVEDALASDRWDGLLQMLNVESGAEAQVKVGRNWVSAEDAGDVTISANTGIRFVVGGGGKGSR